MKRVGILININSYRAPVLYLILFVCLLFISAQTAPGQTGTLYTENFDGVTAPALPPNWQSPTGASFVTVTNNVDTSPNAAYVRAFPAAGSAELVSPILYVGASSKLTFKHRYSFETNYDGAVVEISIDGSAFSDIITAGGSFVAHAYNSTIYATDNPLAGRSGWSGNSSGYVTTEINLPSASAGKSVQIKWRLGTDEYLTAIDNPGWWIDTISLTNAVTVQNAGAITIPSSGTASPYPSEIQVSNWWGTVTKLVVNLENFSHTSPDDVDILLVAPNGRKIVLMSDVGGGNSVSNISLTFDDDAANSLPDSSTLSSGTFKPTDFDTGDSFPSPAPSGSPTGTTLAAFNGAFVNGTWKLFVVDDNGNNAGSISGGWSLIIKNSLTACNAMTLSPAIQAYPASGGNGSFSITLASPCEWKAVSDSAFLTITSSPTIGTGNGSISYSVAANTGGARTGEIDVASGTGTHSFMVQQASGCPTSVSPTEVTVGGGGGNGSVSVTAAGNCTWIAESPVSWITITSTGYQTGNGNATFTVQSNETASRREATITVGVKTFLVVQNGGL